LFKGIELVQIAIPSSSDGGEEDLRRQDRRDAAMANAAADEFSCGFLGSVSSVYRFEFPNDRTEHNSVEPKTKPGLSSAGSGK
jgi:hypothetical protein